MKIVILAAGRGTRLGQPFPKPLTPLETGESIIERQIKQFTRFISIDDIYVVVGFKLKKIIKSIPNLTFVYNPDFKNTNTSKSLMKGLKKIHGNDVLWINGDVVFEEEIINLVMKECANKEPFTVVNTSRVGEEEVKYRTDDNGYICEISKQVKNAQGESVGINFISEDCLEEFIVALDAVDDNDYFEKAMDNCAKNRSILFKTLDISSFNCTEVDFPEDLEKANEFLSRQPVEP